MTRATPGKTTLLYTVGKKGSHEIFLCIDARMSIRTSVTHDSIIVVSHHLTVLICFIVFSSVFTLWYDVGLYVDIGSTATVNT